MINWQVIVARKLKWTENVSNRNEMRQIEVEVVPFCKTFLKIPEIKWW